MNINFKYNEAIFPNEEFALISIIDADWQIDDYSSNFIFREAYPTDDIDFTFCGILNHFGGTLPKIEFARLLGLSLIDIPEENIYRDEAEEMVLDELLNERKIFGLIQITEVPNEDKKTKIQYLKLTDEGQQSINGKIKYRYWKGTMRCFKHYYQYSNANFDFLNQFGLVATIPNKSPVSKSEFQLDKDTSFPFQLTDFQLNQVSEDKFELINIDNFYKERSNNQRVQYVLVEKSETINLLLVLLKNEVQEELTSIINDPRNEEYKNDLVLRCKFKALLEDKTAIFDSKTVNEFLRLWNRAELIKDPRLSWSDDELWSIFNIQFNASEWYLITKEAQVDILKKRVPEFNNRFNWAILSERLDDDFIYKHLYTEGYRWDFEILSSRNTEFVWLLINEITNHNLDKENQQIIPNWDSLLITDSLSNARIELLLPLKFNLDFIQLSKKEPEFVLLCLKEVSKINSNLTENEPPYKAIWDWKYISENWSIATIWNNIELLEDNLNWHIFLNRVFSNVQFTEFFLKSEQFKGRLLKNKEKVRPTFRLESLLWNEQLIDLFNDAEILLWQSNYSQLGFECNSAIVWTPRLLRKYAPFFTTPTGRSHISKSIQSWDFVFVVSDFEWNWNELCQNEHLIFNTYILNHFKNSLNWTILSERIDDNFILGNLTNFDWNFKLLSTIKSDAFITNALNQNNEILQKDWDWQHLTTRLDKNFIRENLVNINEKWDWNYLTREKFTTDEIVELWQTTVQYWDWNYLLTKSFSVTKLTNDDFFILVASCLNLIEEDEFRKNYWSVLTKRMTPDFLAINNYEYLQFAMLQWDWSYLSQHPRFEFTIDFIQKFENKWDWTVLSRNKRINSDWTYLTKFNQFWDWTYLSEFSSFIFTNKNLNIRTLDRFQRFIDFKAFSRRNDIRIDQQLIDNFRNKNWDFTFLSGVKSVKPNQEFLRKYANKNWDWQQLSKRNDLKVEVKQNAEGKEIHEKFINELILEFKDKDWNWEHLSTRTDIEFSSEFIEELSNKNWDFKAISRNKQTVWTTELIKFIQKNNIGLDWDYISKTNEAIYRSPDRLEALKEYLNWDNLSLNQNIELNEDLLRRFAQNWNFRLLTQRKEIIDNPQYFLQYKDENWDWSYFTEKFASQIDINVLSNLSDKIVWNQLSSNRNLQLTTELVTKFKGYWNFVELFKQQRRFEDDVKKVLKPYFDEPKTKFLIEIDNQSSSWKGYVYHFAHLSNASEIIKQASIKSRNSANQVSDSAGSVVNRRHTAHDFARFYFRPQTATQFYNENLGHDPNSEYYGRAANLGYPKCPIPVFFRIGLNEIFNKYLDRCFVSNGNMQTNYAEVFSISHQAIVRFDFENLYSRMNDVFNETKSHFGGQFVDKHIFMAELNKKMSAHKNASQQEFLVKDELNLSNLQTFEIICQTNSDKQALINLIGLESPLANKVIVEDLDIYHNENSRFDIDADEMSLSISTSFRGSGSTIIKTEIENCISEVEGEIYVQKPKITEGGKNLKIIFSKPTKYQVWFKDESRREWLLYSTSNNHGNDKEIIDVKYGNLQPETILNYLKSVEPTLTNIYSETVRHYVLERHTFLVMSEFEKYFSNIELPIKQNLFRFMLALHDIGKPKSIEVGDKNSQYKYTVETIDNLRKSLPFDNSEIDIIVSLVSDDPIGLYFQGTINLENTKNKIIDLSKQANLPTFTFFRLLIIYYQCDTSSYTKDAGGLPFLEHLFSYDNGSKIFDNTAKLIKFSPAIENKFNILQNYLFKNEI